MVRAVRALLLLLQSQQAAGAERGQLALMASGRHGDVYLSPWAMECCSVAVSGGLWGGGAQGRSGGRDGVSGWPSAAGAQEDGRGSGADTDLRKAARAGRGAVVRWWLGARQGMLTSKGAGRG